jgi:hypothetical protein
MKTPFGLFLLFPLLLSNLGYAAHAHEFRVSAKVDLSKIFNNKMGHNYEIQIVDADNGTLYAKESQRTDGEGEPIMRVDQVFRPAESDNNFLNLKLVVMYQSWSIFGPGDWDAKELMTLSVDPSRPNAVQSVKSQEVQVLSWKQENRSESYIINKSGPHETVVSSAVESHEELLKQITKVVESQDFYVEIDTLN